MLLDRVVYAAYKKTSRLASAPFTEQLKAQRSQKDALKKRHNGRGLEWSTRKMWSRLSRALRLAVVRSEDPLRRLELQSTLARSRILETTAVVPSQAFSWGTKADRQRRRFPLRPVAPATQTYGEGGAHAL